MSNSTTQGIEQGRAKFAYECAYQTISLKDFEFNGEKITAEQIIKSLKHKFKENIKENEKDNKYFFSFLSDAKNRHKEYCKKKDNGKNKFEKKLNEYYLKYGKEYKSYAKKIPMLIKINGLGSTFAFIKSKGGTYDLIYQQVTEWLKQEPNQLISDKLRKGEDLEAVIISLNSPEYRALTIEVLAFFNWLRRFADGLIEGDDKNE